MQTKEERKKQYEERKKQYEEQTYIRNDTKHIPAGSHRSHAGGPHPPECLSEILQSGAPEFASDHCFGSRIFRRQLRFYCGGDALFDGGGLLHPDDGHWMHDRHLRLHLHHRPHI